MRVVLVLATLLVVALAGCVSDDDPEPTGSSAPPPEKSTGDEARESPPVSEESPAADDDVMMMEVHKKTYQASGSTSTGVWVCDNTEGTGECNGHEIDAESRIVTFDYTDHMMAADLVLTWERLDNTYRFLVAVVHAIPADGGEPVLLSVGHATSPYEIEIPEAHIGPGTLEVEVWPRSDTGLGPVYLFLDPQTQPFDIEATLTMMRSV